MSGLAGLIVALSISDAPDRARLGFPAREVERAFLTICTALIRAGARILYSGDLRPDGWTFKLFRHLAGAYAGQGEAPFIHLMPEPALRRTPFDDLVRAARESRGTAEAVVVIGGRMRPLWLHQGGLVVDPGGERELLSEALALSAWLERFPEEPTAAALTRARQLAASMSAARVALGGKMGLLEIPADAYEGDMPGIAEEAIMTLQAGRAFVPLGAYGGATRDIAIELGLLPEGARVGRMPQAATYDKAMRVVKTLRTSIPASVRERLCQLADDDRAEWVSREVVEIVSAWAA